MAFEASIKPIMHILEKLLEPINPDDGNGIDHTLEVNMQNVIDTDMFRIVSRQQGIVLYTAQNKSIRERFVHLIVDLLMALSSVLKEIKDEKEKLLSVSQNKTLQNCMQFVIGLGLLPYIPSEIGLTICRSKMMNELQPERLLVLQKYERMRYMANVLITLYSDSTLQHLIVPHHLIDLISVLCVLSCNPLMIPNEEMRHGKVGLTEGEIAWWTDEFEDDTSSIFKMTRQQYNEFMTDKKMYLTHLKSLYNGLYKPLIIENVFRIWHDGNIPGWLKVELSKSIYDLIIQKNGVISMLKAVCGADINDVSANWNKVSALAKMFNLIDTLNPETYKKRVVPQILPLIYLDWSKPYYFSICLVGVLSIRYLYTRNRKIAESLYICKILQPMLESNSNPTEQDITRCIDCLITCYLIPGNSKFSLPYEALDPIITTLFRVYCKIRNTDIGIRQKIKDLIQGYLKDKLKLDNNKNHELFNSLMFNEGTNTIPAVSNTLNVTSGTENGIRFVKSINDSNENDSADCVYGLIRDCMVNNVIQTFLIYLLKEFVFRKRREMDNLENANKLLIISSLLEQLISDIDIQRYLLTNPAPLIPVIGEIIEKFDDDKILTGVLMFLALLLEDIKYRKEKFDWSILKDLLPSLKILKMSSVNVIRSLSEKIYNSIVTKNLIGNVKELELQSNILSMMKSNSSRQKTICETAIEDACDALLPVRAHGMMELIRLLKNNDQETIDKIDAIICIFKENMKDEDSYLYLRAIEGLTTLTLHNAKDALPLLCEEYCNLHHNTQIRLKVGECLLRVTQSLCDFLYIHKNHLLNTFLFGARDSDNLIRASSLSNLAEVCRRLNCNLQSITTEIIRCMLDVIDHDSFQEPRRAAVLVIRMILEGNYESLRQILKYKELQDLFYTLRDLYRNDPDDAVRLQAQLCLEHMNDKMQSFLFPKSTMVKSID